MNKRIFWILGISAVVFVSGLAAFWLVSPMAFGHTGNSMGLGMMDHNWPSFAWFGLAFATFWFIPMVLVATLVTWVLNPKLQKQDSQEV